MFSGKCRKYIFYFQTGCQEDEDESYDGDDDDQQAEFDAMLIEYSGDCLPALAEALGGQAFAPYFAGFMPLLLKKIVSDVYFDYVILRACLHGVKLYLLLTRRDTLFAR
jgi:hypothetical protein